MSAFIMTFVNKEFPCSGSNDAKTVAVNVESGLEKQIQDYESKIVYYQTEIRNYESHIAMFGGRYWEDDTVHRKEAQRRHERYIQLKKERDAFVDEYAVAYIKYGTAMGIQACDY
jgi:hypothetical protein